MRKISNISRIIVVLMVIAIASVSLWAIATLPPWHGTVTFQETPGFSVWNAPTGGSNLTSPYTLPLDGVNNNAVSNTTFYLQNDGGYNLSISVANGTPVNCAASWSNNTFILPVGSTRVPDILTITITGTGSYSWDFTATTV